jgi:hypothetical protein
MVDQMIAEWRVRWLDLYRLLSGRLRFNSWLMRAEEPTEDILEDYFDRGHALFCQLNQKGADAILPLMLCKMKANEETELQNVSEQDFRIKLEAIPWEVHPSAFDCFSMVVIQIKNRFNDNQFTKADENLTIDKCFPKMKDSMVATELPYLTFHLSLRSTAKDSIFTQNKNQFCVAVPGLDVHYKIEGDILGQLKKLLNCYVPFAEVAKFGRKESQLRYISKRCASNKQHL